MNQQALGLDEALITVNRSFSAPIDVYYQVAECFGCRLERYTSLSEKLQDFVIGTKHRLFLELRNQVAQENQANEGGSVICRLNNLDLNNHGHYRIDVRDLELRTTISSLSSTSSSQLQLAHKNLTLPKDYQECSFKTLDKGDCSLCPLALLISLLLILTVGEKIWFKCTSSSSTSHRKGNSTKRKEVSSSRSAGNAAEQNSSSSGQRLAGSQEEEEQQGQVAEVEEEENGAPVATNNQQAMEPNDTAHNDDGRQAVESVGIENNNKQPNKTVIKNRIHSLDAFRGFTIAGMIMVNYGGAGYSILQHKAWDGVTLADFVFPFFIFSMGASIAISTRSMVRGGKSFQQMFVKIVRRSTVLMLLGLCLNSRALQGKSLYHLRLTGVLQRFSISYLVVALVFSVSMTINKWVKAQSLYRVPILSRILVVFFELMTAFYYLAAYIYVTFYLDYSPNCPIGYVGPGGETEGGKYANCTGGAAAWLDRWVLKENHMYNDREVKQVFKTNVTHDPEGILGNTTSILLTMMGLQCGKILLKFEDHKTRLFKFSQWMAILAISCIAVIVIPINKRLWSLTFVTLTGSSAFAMIILFYLVIDVLKCQDSLLLKLLISAGKNSITLYVGHSLLGDMLPWYFAVDESSHLQLLFRLTWSVFAWLIVAHFMASKKIFIKI